VDSAVVTGAGRGLGRAIAARLAHRGLAVTATDVNAEGAVRTAEEIGSGATSTRLDVRDAEGCRRVAAEAAQRGRLAVWVNNAGILRTEPAWEQADATVEQIVQVNLLGVINGCRAALPHMRSGGGRILNIASLSSLGAAPGLAVYGATKHGVLAYSISLQAELQDAGIPVEVRAICPDAIETDMVRERAQDPEASLIFSGALLTADEVADRAIRLLYGKSILVTVPRARGALARAIYLVPRAGLRLLPAFKKLGERNRERWREAG
jgi:NAD(P)-dependent dehydrogenase (short-subunit alcohol dehydrogenase family)